MTPIRRDPEFIKNMLESSIQIGLLLVIVFWSFHIISPFVLPILWGAILAVVLWPLTLRLSRILGGRHKIAITLVVLTGIVVLVVPSYFLIDSMVNSLKHLFHSIETGSFDIPAPPDKVGSWPIIGQPVSEFWNLASTNIEAAIEKAKPELVAIGRWVAGRSLGIVMSVLIFVVSLLIAGAFMKRADSMTGAARKFATRIGGEGGAEWVKLSADTINSVIAGVLGVAIIQAFLLAVGMFLLGVPGAGLLTVIALFFAIIQVPNVILMIPVIIYVYSAHDATPATIFAIWSLFGATSNLWLGPMLMGRGVNIPMLIVFLGAIGGMIYQGIIGLFVGAVVLALAYTLYSQWVNEDVSEGELEGAES